MNTFNEKLTVIFLGNEIPPQSIVLLKRGVKRTFAPNRYTGIGGKIEKNENQLTGALRELKEEVGIDGIELREFGRVIVSDRKLLFYFFGITPFQSLPYCSEGELEWVSMDKLLGKDLIPTTKVFIEQWKKRLWSIEKLFTVYIERADVNNIDAPISSITIKEGLTII